MLLPLRTFGSPFSVCNFVSCFPFWYDFHAIKPSLLVYILFSVAQVYIPVITAEETCSCCPLCCFRLPESTGCLSAVCHLFWVLHRHESLWCAAFMPPSFIYHVRACIRTWFHLWLNTVDLFKHMPCSPALCVDCRTEIIVFMWYCRFLYKCRLMVSHNVQNVSSASITLSVDCIIYTTILLVIVKIFMF